LRNCSRSAAVRRLYALQLAFPHNTLVPLVHAFYPIFKLAAVLGQFLYDFIRAAGDVATDGGDELYELADVKFVGWHGGSVSSVKTNRMYHGKPWIAVGFANGEGLEKQEPPTERSGALRDAPA
jgi:hypothetical protein